MHRIFQRRTLIAMEVTFAIGTCLYWLAYSRGMLKLDDNPGQQMASCAYEGAFPLADLLLAALMLLTAFVTWRRSRYAIILQACCGGAITYLGILDVTFNLKNSIYAGGTLSLLIIALINIICLAFGALLLI